MKIDLDALEQKARAAQAVDLEKFRSEIQASLSRGREGIHRPVRVPPEIDAHIEANDPPVTLALIARIRELEEALGGALTDWNICDRHDDWQDERGTRRVVLEKGAVLP